MRPGACRSVWSLALATGVLTAPAAAQRQPEALDVRGGDGRMYTVRVRWDGGFAAAWVGALTSRGWDVNAHGDSAVAVDPGGHRYVFRAMTPFASRDGATLQLVEAPYLLDDALYLPLQAMSELAGSAPADGVAAEGASGPSPPLIVIDAGHGGRDLGTIGYGGTLEKNVVLDLALVLERELSGHGFRVLLTRSTDEYIPVWDRGPLATEWKGSRTGLFVSLHVNANPQARAVRGLETYFLADARTEHERRLAELENAPAPGFAARGESGEDLSRILNELRNLDHQRWSARLAEVVHDEVAAVHPGPDRGVRQAPLAVLTNALMPAVLIEVGYVTNREEEELLNRASFRARVAEAITRGVRAFLNDYPPSGPGATAGRPL